MQNTNSKNNSYLKLIPGREIAATKEAWLKQKLLELGNAPKLRIVQVGNDPASTLYVNLKVAKAKAIGIDASQHVYPSGTGSEEIIAGISKLNLDESVHGVMVQSPIANLELPESLRIFNAIAPAKDVDGLSYASLGKLWQLKTLSELEATGIFLSATPLAALDCLLWQLEQSVGNEANPFTYSRFKRLPELLSGKKVLIINRSNIVGKPLAALLMMADATVTLAHSRSENINELIAAHEFILTATGVDHLFMLEQFTGKTVIDIGINNNSPDNTLKGDVAFPAASQLQLDSGSRPTYLAPVPGGVGPLTVINLLANTFLSYSRANGLTR